jgi:hypothetical protein
MKFRPPPPKAPAGSLVECQTLLAAALLASEPERAAILHRLLRLL